MSSTPSLPTAGPSAPGVLRSREALGWTLGLAGVLGFSLTLPMTRLAVAELDPWIIAFGRMAIAGLISAAWLWLIRAPRPTRAQLLLLVRTAGGVVVGFPLLTSLAMQVVPSPHGAVIVGVLPLASAVLAAAWFGERQPLRFWVCAVLGAALVAGFVLFDRHGARGLVWGDLALFVAVAAAAVGYAAGARLSQDLGGMRVIMWALTLTLPLSLPAALAAARWAPAQSWAAASAGAWGCFAYVTVVSQLIAFFAWYNGLAIGGTARIGQIQLLQVFFTIGAAALFFAEPASRWTWLFALAVVATIIAGRSAPAAAERSPR